MRGGLSAEDCARIRAVRVGRSYRAAQSPECSRIHAKEPTMSTTPSIATRYTARYGVRHPFACAGLAFAGMTPDLAIAVSKAGGIGAIGVGFTPPDLLRVYIRAVKA